jgi:tetratricopeptide (TPR) repeat protein
MEFSKQRPLASLEEFEEVLDELVAMNFPLLAVGVHELHPQYPLDLLDYRGAFAISVATMLAGDYEDALAKFVAANRLQPAEPAPYVNIAQILIYQERRKEAELWLLDGLAQEKNNHNLWQLLGELYFEMNSETFIARVLDQALVLNSWAGVSLCASQDGGLRIEEKLLHFQRIFSAGERSVDFIIEYTALLGELDRFADIPPLIWQLEKQDKLPWQVYFHASQAHLAMHEFDQALAYSNRLRFLPDLPHALVPELEKIEEQCMRREIATTDTSVH